jgi:NADP-dependent 3-hydroxy acid dehydrogenase YdfG
MSERGPAHDPGNVQRTVDEMGRLDILVLGARAFSEALRQEVTGPRHVAVNELVVRPTEQEG